MSPTSPVTENPPLVRPDLTFDEAAIRAYAEFEFGTHQAGPVRERWTMERAERQARRVAEGLRARMADGSAQREREAHEANLRRYQEQAEADALLPPAARAERDAWTIRQCSTDGRLS